MLRGPMRRRYLLPLGGLVGLVCGLVVGLLARGGDGGLLSELIVYACVMGAVPTGVVWGLVLSTNWLARLEGVAGALISLVSGAVFPLLVFVLLSPEDAEGILQDSDGRALASSSALTALVLFLIVPRRHQILDLPRYH